MNPFILFTLKSSLCLSAGIVVYWFLLRHETFHRVKRFILLGILLLSVALPLVKLKVDAAPADHRPDQPGLAIFTAAPANQPVQGPGDPQATRQTPARVDPVMLIYLAGASIQVLILLWSLMGVFRILSASEKTRHGGHQLALAPPGTLPFCFGRYIVLSETDFRTSGRDILLHEQAHLEAAHAIDLLLAELFLVMTWYNPFTWLLRHEMRQNHECEADRHALQNGANEAEYQLLLLRTAAGDRRFTLASQLDQSNLKNRFKMMNKRRSGPWSVLKVLVFVPLTILMVQVVAQKVPVNNNAAAAGKNPGKYLELTPGQLKTLGFEFDESGLYYKNIRHGKSDNGMTCLYFTIKNYSVSIQLDPGEKLTGRKGPEKILKTMPLTTFDFYPVVVSGISGHRTLDMSASEPTGSKGLLPVQVAMAGITGGKRSDTLVFWFKPTPSLTKILPKGFSTDAFIQDCPETGTPAGKNR